MTKTHLQAGATISGIVISAIILLCLAHPVSKNANQRIAEVSTIVSAFAGLATLALGICAYKRYFIDERIVDENAKAVINVIKCFQKLEFTVSSKTFLLFVRFKDKNIYSQFAKFELTRVCFTTEAFSKLSSFVSSCQSPFLPKTIAKALEKLTPFLGDEIDNKTDCAVVDSGFGKQSKMFRFNQQDLNLKDFLNMFFDLHASITGWMKEHSSAIDVSF